MTTEKISKQIAYKRKRIARGDKLVCVWMDAETDAIWKRMHPQHGGCEQTLAEALRQMEMRVSTLRALSR